MSAIGVSPTNPKESSQDFIDLLECFLIKTEHHQLVQRYRCENRTD
jgi:hypothetical protein